MTSDVPARLAARAAQAGLTLGPALSSRLLVYFDLLSRWNRTINLTSLSDPDEAIDRLILEPLAAAQLLPGGALLVDLGSGGGSPAIPLALALGTRTVVLIESRARKAAFLREALRELQLHGTVETARFEAVARDPSYAGTADLVSIRAVRIDEGTLSVAALFLKPGGIAALFRGPAPDALPTLPDSLRWVSTDSLLDSTQSQLGRFQRV